MSVYVDDANIAVSVPNGKRTVTSRWCHMTADSTAELLDMASAIGLKHVWIQRAGKPGEHFDLTITRRRAAVRAGAIEITWRQGARQMMAQAKGLPWSHTDPY